MAPNSSALPACAKESCEKACSAARVRRVRQECMSCKNTNVTNSRQPPKLRAFSDQWSQLDVMGCRLRTDSPQSHRATEKTFRTPGSSRVSASVSSSAFENTEVGEDTEIKSKPAKILIVSCTDKTRASHAKSLSRKETHEAQKTIGWFHAGHISVRGSTSMTRAVAPHLCSSAKARMRCSSSLSVLRLAAFTRNW